MYFPPNFKHWSSHHLSWVWVRWWTCQTLWSAGARFSVTTVPATVRCVPTPSDTPTCPSHRSRHRHYNNNFTINYFSDGAAPRAWNRLPMELKLLHRVTTLFEQWFSTTFPWPKNEFPWPIGTAYFFEINDTRFMNAYQNKNIASFQLQTGWYLQKQKF